MYENQNDRQFDNSGKGQNEEDSQNKENTLTQKQRRPDRTEDPDSNYPSTGRDKTGVIVGGHSEGNQNEEHELNRLHGVPKNNDFSSTMNNEVEREDELDEEEDEIDLDEEELEDLDVEKVSDEYEVTNPNIYGDEPNDLEDSKYHQRGDNYRNEER